MNLIDIIIIIIVVVFCIRGYLKGFLHGIFILLIIVLGLAGGFLFYRQLSVLLSGYIGSGDGARILSFFCIFIGITIILLIIRNMMTRFMDRLQLTDLDYILGVFLGLVKGVLLCGLILIFLKNHPVFKIDEIIGKSLFFPFLQRLFTALISLMPDSMSVFIRMILGN